MRIWLMSDLHLGVGIPGLGFKMPRKRPACDVVVIAGDLCEGMATGVQWIAQQGFTKQVIYIRGNHEPYRHDCVRDLEAARKEAKKHPGIHVLQDEHIDIGGTRFICSTLWTDYCLEGEGWRDRAITAARSGMNDHRMIGFGNRLWKPEDAAVEHRQSVEYIEYMLRQPFAGPKVVVTHHAPSKKSISADMRRGILDAAYASNLDHLVDRADLWIHGHNHKARDYRIGAGRVVANPHGYAGYQRTGFVKTRVVDVVKSTEDVES